MLVHFQSLWFLLRSGFSREHLYVQVFPPSGTVLVPFVPHLYYFQKGFSTSMYHGHRSVFLTRGWP